MCVCVCVCVYLFFMCINVRSQNKLQGTELLFFLRCECVGWGGGDYLNENNEGPRGMNEVLKK